MRILVCGDRKWDDKPFINKILFEYWAIHRDEDFVIIHGAAKGADSIAGEIAREQGVKEEAFPAKWEKHGKAAGPIRNQQMLTEGKPDLVLAFHDNIEKSKGTRDMVAKAKRAGIETRVYSHSSICKVYPAKEQNGEEKTKATS